ncbi:MAG: 2-oxoglutarate dehydrogenase E1 component [Planctomycetaceae bacterium]|nr:2-oxoglutarate dehydrogenase E1 component [Planctomycetaceae bacterium]
MSVLSREEVERLYLDFQQDPTPFSPEWRDYFTKFALWKSKYRSESHGGNTNGATASEAVLSNGSTESVKRPLRAYSLFRSHSATEGQEASERDMSIAQLQDRVDQLVRGFRVRGHLEAKVDPLGRPRPTNRDLHPETYGLLASDMDRPFSTRTIFGDNIRTLGEIVQKLRNTYCRSIGAQFMHIDDHDIRNWLQNRMEGSENRVHLDRTTQLRVLTRLTDAVVFEEFVRKKFVGAKTFSLEGAESLIPLLDTVMEKAGEHGVREAVLGMAHRGRLNVLANIMGKRNENIFWSFDDPNPDANRGGGDVLYHLGYSTNWITSQNQNIHISLCFNPSHLEFVNPVAMGRCRSKQDRIEDVDHKQVMTVLIHGDAAFAGEGIVQETLNLSQLAGYQVGGTLHVILNNQVGFTTTEQEGRSTTYASDVAKMLQIPIFHVNGEDPEAVAQVVQLAMDFRHQFQRDVVIDMYCYRRLGHNESDEPRYTQPLMYEVIDARPTVRDSYLEHLLQMNEVTREEADRIAEARRSKLQSDFERANVEKYEPDTQTMGGHWESYYGGELREEERYLDTGVPLGKLSYVINKLAEVPTGFNLNSKLVRPLQMRAEMAGDKRPIDWATAELAAFGTLALEGHPIRLSGQDCGRGTFSQRHAILHDTATEKRYCGLKHLSDDQAMVDVINSPLSEAGVLGFDYGYSLDTPEGLTVWEAQFGDFSNAAQVIIDQFITSAEDKWRRLSNLVMMLPHGFEGAGPEHCSARLERYLMLSAENNIQVVYPTTAAQHFHVLRRQVKRNWRKPLVILTPKGLLRDPDVSSPLQDLTKGCFRDVIDDPYVTDPQGIKRVLLCTGKIAVELLKERNTRGKKDTAIVRLEQLYPLPLADLQKTLARYGTDFQLFWVQEEPWNMGAWQFLLTRLGERVFGKYQLNLVSRDESASPSTGSKNAHKLEQKDVIDAALGK